MTTETPLVWGHRLTPSFTDSAIDVELTEEFAHDQDHEDEDEVVDTTASSSHVTRLNERIVHIAQLVADKNALRGLSQDDCAAVSTYLDNIEKLLDPRRDISQAIALGRPSSSTSNATPTTKISPAIADYRHKSIPKGTTQSQTVSHDLTSILQELTNVNTELRQRYLESRHIHDVFIVKCEGLAQRILELEEEVHELKSDILEDTIELEGLRGTVRGLDSWVGRWQRQRESSSPSSSSKADAGRRSKGRSYWRRKAKSTTDKNEEEEDGNDFDTFLDGVLAWMRGWNDVEEGFLIRARRRKLRRDRKNHPQESI
ncbi:pogo transposable element [Talaromyces pinophilus]|uniref:Pogo transposable element n=1 Tax=Talaromyces pinophilus TaxID=128442 RepID=A0A510NWR8_TALPI|nr:pogo transposable element [Talaromyces pinophilus]